MFAARVQNENAGILKTEQRANALQYQSQQIVFFAHARNRLADFEQNFVV